MSDTNTDVRSLVGGPGVERRFRIVDPGDGPPRRPDRRRDPPSPSKTPPRRPRSRRGEAVSPRPTRHVVGSKSSTREGPPPSVRPPLTTDRPSLPSRDGSGGRSSWWTGTARRRPRSKAKPPRARAPWRKDCRPRVDSAPARAAEIRIPPDTSAHTARRLDPDCGPRRRRHLEGGGQDTARAPIDRKSGGDPRPTRSW